MKDLVLIIEDNDDILENIHYILQFNNFDSIVARNGKEALKLLKSRDINPDLIVSDILMPEMDGYEFLKIISQNPRWYNIPFIFLTAKASPEDILIGKSLGVDDYITKPFQEEVLLTSIKGKIRKKKNIEIINKKISQAFKIGESTRSQIEPLKKYAEVCLFYGEFNQKNEIKLEKFYPYNWSLEINIHDVGLLLFENTIFVQHSDIGDFHHELLLNIPSIQRFAYLVFIVKKEINEEKITAILCTLAERIDYLHSLEIKQIYDQIVTDNNMNKTWDIKESWTKINHILKKLY